jgi:outer membrane protein
MRKKSYFSLVVILFFGLFTQAQSKKWTLEECVKYALENNISIKQSELDTQTATIDKKSALGNFLPSMNATTNHSWNIGLNQDITTGLLRNQTTQFTSTGVNVGIDIYKGLQNQNNLRKANLALIASKYQLLKMQEDIALNVANAFLQVLFNKENLKVQQEQLAINEKQLNRSIELVNAGAIPRGDVLDIKANLASNRQNVVAAENALLISKLSLAQLLQLKDFENFDLIDAISVNEDVAVLSQSPSAIIEKAKETRTDLKIAQTNLEIAQKNLAIAKGTFQPTIQGFYGFNTRISYADVATISGNTIVTKPANPFWTQFSDNKGQSFGAQLSIPVFNGFSARNNVERSKVNLEKSKIALEQQNLDLQRTIYAAFTDAKGSLNANESAISTLEARQEAYNYAKEKYAVGMMNSFDYNQAQTLLVNAQSEVLRTKYDSIFKIKILEFYFGIPIIKN